jgi:hypothetical protein
MGIYWNEHTGLHARPRWWNWPSIGVLFVVSVVSGQSPEWTSKEREREAFLCRWLPQHQLLATHRPLDFCRDPHTDVGVALIQQDGFWSDQLKTTKTQFEADWEASPELQRRNFAAEAAHAKVVEAFHASVQSRSTFELCEEFNRNGRKSAGAELVRRKAFTDRQWQLIQRNRIEVGMPEDALICSWGRTKVNRTVTARHTHMQYVYDSGAYVYVDDGIVTSFQDSR